MKQVIFIALSILIISKGKAQTHDVCKVKNTTFKAGESLTMKVYYSAAGAYIAAGEATFTTTLEKLNNKPVYHCIGEGKTFPVFDKFFKVRDKYESYLDTTTLLPQKFVRNVQEGTYKKYNNVQFNQTTKTAVTNNGVFKVNPCIQDVISMSYGARNINFEKMKPGDKIPFTIFLDDEMFSIYVKYMGKEKVTTKFGKFNAIKLKPLLIKGNMFDGGEKMNLWISDDANKIILRVETPISVGSVKIDMMQYKNLRYPLTSLISAAE